MAATTNKTTVSTTKYTPYDVSKDYAKAEEAYRKAQQAAYDSQKSSIEYQKQQLTQDYRNQRSDVYKNARVNAIGNNEALAARGLAGNAYQNPRSGASETARINENVNFRNNLNLANRQEQSAKDALAQQLVEAGYTRDASIAEYMAELALQKSSAMREENQFATQFNYQAERDKIADDQWQKAYDYQAERDRIADSQWQKEFDLAVADGDYSKALAMAETLAAAGDFSGYSKLGYSASQINALKKAYNAANAASGSGGGSSRRSRSSGGSSSGFTDTSGTADLENQINTALRYGSVTKATELLADAVEQGQISRTYANSYMDRIDPQGTRGRF